MILQVGGVPNSPRKKIHHPILQLPPLITSLTYQPSDPKNSRVMPWIYPPSQDSRIPGAHKHDLVILPGDDWLVVGRGVGKIQLPGKKFSLYIGIFRGPSSLPMVFDGSSSQPHFFWLAKKFTRLQTLHLPNSRNDFSSNKLFLSDATVAMEITPGWAGKYSMQRVDYLYTYVVAY